MMIFISVMTFFGIFVLAIFMIYVNGYGFQGKKRGAAAPRIIREAVEKLPTALSFATPDGYPFLTNQRMNDMIFRLFGHTVLDAEETWKEIREGELPEGIERLNEDIIFTGPEAIRQQIPGDEEDIYLRMPGNRVIRFRREILHNGEDEADYIQISGDDVTRLIIAREKVEEENVHLEHQKMRQQEILQEIVRVNHEQELLSAKMRVHSVFGENLILSEQAANGEPTESMSNLIRRWRTSVQNLGAVSEDHLVWKNQGDSSREELNRVAGMIGCRIRYFGKPPEEPELTSFFYAAIREALTNAVRHAGANELYVEIRREPDRYLAQIWDNGRKLQEPDKEERVWDKGDTELFLGDGLKNLRKKMEQKGAGLHLVQEERVKLMLELPLEK